MKCHNKDCAECIDSECEEYFGDEKNCPDRKLLQETVKK